MYYYGLVPEFNASASYDQTAKVWDADTGECLKTLRADVSAVFACGDYGRHYGDYYLDDRSELPFIML